MPKGVDVSFTELIQASREAVDADPANAQASFAVSGALTGPTEVSLHARGHSITVDEPAVLGGEDRGANRSSMP
jgi:hypothetical protein